MAKAEQAQRTDRELIRAARGLTASSDIERDAAAIAEEAVRIDRIMTRLLRSASDSSERHGMPAIYDAMPTPEMERFTRAMIAAAQAWHAAHSSSPAPVLYEEAQQA